MGSSRTRAQTCDSCIGRQILNHCATREAQHQCMLNTEYGACYSVDDQKIFVEIFFSGTPVGLELLLPSKIYICAVWISRAFKISVLFPRFKEILAIGQVGGYTCEAQISFWPLKSLTESASSVAIRNYWCTALKQFQKLCVYVCVCVYLMKMFWEKIFLVLFPISHMLHSTVLPFLFPWPCGAKPRPRQKPQVGS